jgi:mono/diheme cytochrome c family protein
MVLTKNTLLKNLKTRSNMKRNRTILLIFLLSMTVTRLYSQVWEVPADQKAVKNPSALNNANVKTGKDLYMINCKSCHGDPGKKNALPLVPPPPDMASEKMQANTDADIFYKMTTGRVAMPAFENTIAPEQRWKIVNFIKSFDPANKGLLIPVVPVKAMLEATADTSKPVILISALVQDKQGNWGPLQKTEVTISAKRTFGKIEVGKAITNEQGNAEFQFPKDFIGDKDGSVDLTLTLGEDYSCDVVELNQLKIATPVIPENIFTHRVLWSTNARTSIWLILTYIGVVGGVWLTIFYIIFLIFKIYKAGKY